MIKAQTRNKLKKLFSPELEKRRLARQRYMRVYLKKYRRHYPNKRIQLTLSPQEFADFRKTADIRGESLAGFSKKVLVSSLRKQGSISKKVEDQLRDLKLVFRSLGNNLNQIASRTNKLRFLSFRDYNRAIKTVYEMEGKLEQFLNSQFLNDCKIAKQKKQKLWGTG